MRPDRRVPAARAGPRRPGQATRSQNDYGGSCPWPWSRNRPPCGGGPASGMRVRGQARRGSGFPTPRLPGGGIPQERQNLVTEQAILITAAPEPQPRMAAPRAQPPSAAHVVFMLTSHLVTP